MQLKACAVVGGVLCMSYSHELMAAENCSGLSDRKQTELIEYIKRKYRITKDVSLKIQREVPETTDCYQRLEFLVG